MSLDINRTETKVVAFPFRLEARQKAQEEPEVSYDSIHPDRFSSTAATATRSLPSGAWWQSADTLHPFAYQEATPFVGREFETASLVDLLSAPAQRLLTLTGEEGIGKTRLAMAVAETVVPSFAHGTAFIRWGGESMLQPDALALMIEQALQLRLSLSSGEEAQARLFARLYDKNCLLIVDDLPARREHIAFIRRLLRAAPQTTVMLTAPVALGLREEHVILVKGLPIPGGQPPDERGDFSSVQLFYERASQAYPRFTPSRCDLSIVAEICDLVKGIPLAIELVASQVNRLRCTQLARILHHIIATLPPSASDPEVRAAFTLTWNSLSTAERRTIAQLSVFRGGFTSQAALEITEATPALLIALRRRALLYSLSSGRYAMHSLVRRLAAEKLEAMTASGELDAHALRERHCRFYLARIEAQRFTCNSMTMPQAAVDLIPDLANVAWAWHWATMHLKTALIQRSMDGLAHFFDCTGLAVTAERLFGLVTKRVHALVYGAERPARGLQRLLGALMVHQAHFLNRQARHEAAMTAALSAIGLAHRTRTLATEAAAYLEWGRGLLAHGQADEAQARLEHAQTLARQAQTLSIEAESLRLLGDVHARRTMPDEAVSCYEQALRLYRAVSDPVSEITLLLRLGKLTAARRRALAIAYFEQALHLCHTLGDAACEAHVIAHLKQARLARRE